MGGKQNDYMNLPTNKYDEVILLPDDMIDENIYKQAKYFYSGDYDQKLFAATIRNAVVKKRVRSIVVIDHPVYASRARYIHIDDGYELMDIRNKKITRTAAQEVEEEKEAELKHQGLTRRNPGTRKIKQQVIPAPAESINRMVNKQASNDCVSGEKIYSELSSMNQKLSVLIELWRQ